MLRGNASKLLNTGLTPLYSRCTQTRRSSLQVANSGLPSTMEGPALSGPDWGGDRLTITDDDYG